MKNLLFFFLVLVTCISVSYRTNAETKQPLTQAQCKQLIEERGYDALGAFDTIYHPNILRAVYIKNGKFGMIDQFGKEITPPIYSAIPSLNTDLRDYSTAKHDILIVVTDAYGLIDLNGNIVVEPQYIHISHQLESVPEVDGDERNHLSVINGYKVLQKVVGFEAAISYGESVYYDARGKVIEPDAGSSNSKPRQQLEIVEDDYDEIHEYISDVRKPEMLPNYGREWTSRRGNIVGYKNDTIKKCGVMNVVTGDTVIPFEYDAVYINYRKQIGLTIWDSISNNKIVKKRHGLADQTGKMIIEPIYESVLPFNDLIQVVKDEKMALFSQDGKQLSKFIYGPKMGSGNGDFIVLQKGENWGLVNMEGKELTRFVYQNFYFPNSHDLPFSAIIPSKDGKKAIWDYEMNRYTPFHYGAIMAECNIKKGDSRPFLEGGTYHANRPNRFFVVGMPTGELDWRKQPILKFGIMDTNYKEIVPCTYDRILNGYYDILIVQNERKYACLNWRTNELVTEWIDNQPEEKNGKYLLFKKEGKFGMINHAGEVVVPFKHPYRFSIETTYPGLKRVYDYSGMEYYYDGYGNGVEVKKRR